MRVTLLIALLAFVGPPDRPNPTPKEKTRPIQQQVLGEWRLSSALVGGDPKAAPPNAKDTVLIFTGTEIHVRENGKQNQSDDATYNLDVAKKPVAIDLMPKRGGEKKIEGILKVEGDQLTICFAFGGQGARPTDFVSTPNTQNALMQFTRIKK